MVYPSRSDALSAAAAAATAVMKTAQGWGPGLGQNLEPGEVVVFTLGAETYAPVPYHTFTVGPFAAHVKIRKDEDLEQLVKRTYAFLATLFEAEFEIKRKGYYERIGEAAEDPTKKNKGAAKK